MSCGGSPLVTGMCGGCGPSVNAHESYKGSSFTGGSAMNYSANMKYAGQDTPLPRTATGRSYALERIYVGKSDVAGAPERVYRAVSLSSPNSFESSSRFTTELTSPALNDVKPARYDAHAAITELMGMADTYNKQRVLEHKIAEAFEMKNLGTLVNING